MSMIGNYLRIREARLAELLAHPDTVSDLLYPEEDSGPEMSIDIDKSWHVIHFLLNGAPWDGEWPLVGAVLGGTELSDEDVGYGPARYLTPAQVREVSEALQLITPDALWARFDADAIRKADLYPQGWEGSVHDQEYIAANYLRLQGFFKACAEGHDAVIECLS
jgi:hypothetical protein